MTPARKTFFASFRAELIQLKRSPLLIFLATLQAVTFIFLVQFFGMAGAFAPTALVNYDRGAYSRVFIKNLENAHHSFSLKFMDEKSALDGIKRGQLVAMIVIPRDFSTTIAGGGTAPLKVMVDNIDTDMTEDIQRALPSAISKFGQQLNFPDIRVRTEEFDLINHDTGFIPYLVTSALALSAFIIAAIMGAVTTAREFETKSAELVAISPAPPMISLTGRILATNVVGVLALLVAVGIVVVGHGIIPAHPFELVAALICCVIIFGLIGAAFGAAIKRALPVASLIFGISLPLYLFSGTYEPERFDGNVIWTIAHFTPLYYAVGILEHAVLNLRVTPEPVAADFLALSGWLLVSLLALRFFTRRAAV